jgi:hypothetical protein
MDDDPLDDDHRKSHARLCEPAAVVATGQGWVIHPDRLDFGDLAAVEVWLATLKQTIDDVDGVVVDMLKPARQRELGHVLHGQHYAAAAESLRQLIAYAALPPPHGDPSGNGGGGPVH